MKQLKGLLRPILDKTCLKRLLHTTMDHDHNSIVITDQSTIEAFKNDPNHTLLVSFPRTGSHWLRMLMELYFGRPSLVRIFYYPEKNDYLTLHTHDLELDAECRSVIYLYRDPVNTVYSQLRYHKEDINNRDRITYWSDLYGRHLAKWLHQEGFTRKKTIVRYERFKDPGNDEFRKICDHFKEPFEKERLDLAMSRVSKEHVQEKTVHDQQVINLTRQYTEERKRFHDRQGGFVWQVLFDGREHLRKDL